MIRTFQALMHVTPGFTDPNSIQTFRFYIPETQIPDTEPERVVRMQEEIRNKLAGLPGVSSVSIASHVPMDGNSNSDVLFAQDHPLGEGELPPLRRFESVSPGFFATLGTKIVAGRDITWNETYSARPVVLISENFAREYWHDANSALGKKVRIASTDDWREVIGVVQNTHADGVDQPAPPTVYWPLINNNYEGQKHQFTRGIAFVLRSPRAGTQAFFNEVEQQAWSVDPDVPLANPMTLGEMYTKSMARTSFTLEIGIRMALGAQRNTLTALFVRQGLWLTGIGVACGLVAAFATMRLMSSLLFNVSPVDPITYAAITAGVATTACFACYLPSRRAATVNPVNALRSE